MTNDIDWLHAEEWQEAIAHFLVRQDGVGMAEVAREALGRPYGQMSVEDWRRLAGIVKGLGLRQYGGLWWWGLKHERRSAAKPSALKSIGR
jgi:hypothetical protein